jgi:hypothetical protein
MTLKQQILEILQDRFWTRKPEKDADKILSLFAKEKEKWVGEIEKKFIIEFCNDHNPKQGIRWLRGVAIDMEDLLEMILKFLRESYK